MFKLCIFAAIVCAVHAGVIGTGIGIGGIGVGGLDGGIGGHGVIATPVVVASSYQNHNSISLHPTAVVAKVAAPIAVSVGHVGLGGQGIGLGGVGLGGSGLGGIGLGAIGHI